MPGKLTTHALDLYSGRPAAGLQIQLYRVGASGSRLPLNAMTTNADGRTDTPLLEEDAMEIGILELVFQVGAYFARTGVPLSDPPFLGEVPVRFAIADCSLGYHVPLLFSPWAYSTYRGS